MKISEVVERLVKGEVLADFEWTRAEAAKILHEWLNQRWHEDVCTIASVMPAMLLGIFALTLAQDSKRKGGGSHGE